MTDVGLLDGVALDVDPDAFPVEATGNDDGDSGYVEVPDDPDVDPLFSPVTQKTYKTLRGKKVAESRFRNRRGGVSGSPKPRASTASLKRRLQSAYEMVGATVGLIPPLMADGQVIINSAPVCAEAVAEWADSDPRVREALERILTGSAISKVVMAHVPIALGIMANHGVNPLGALMSRQSTSDIES